MTTVCGGRASTPWRVVPCAGSENFPPLCAATGAAASRPATSAVPRSNLFSLMKLQCMYRTSTYLWRCRRFQHDSGTRRPLKECPEMGRIFPKPDSEQVRIQDRTTRKSFCDNILVQQA